MWVARDKNGALYLYEHKPTGKYGSWFDLEADDADFLIRLDDSRFPELKWEDEPIEVDIIQKSSDVAKRLTEMLAQAKKYGVQGEVEISDDFTPDKMVEQFKRWFGEL